MVNQNLIDASLNVNETIIKQLMGKSDDIIYREISFGLNNDTKALLCFIDGLVDKKVIEEHIIKPLLVNIHIIYDKDLNHEQCNNQLNNIKNQVLNAAEIIEVNSFDKMIYYILLGSTALFIDGCTSALCISAKVSETRESNIAQTEGNIKGTRICFSEQLRVNTSLLRKIIRNTNLTFETMKLGNQTNTDIAIAYIDSIADIKVVEDVRNRLHSINTDSILDSGYIEQLIEENKYTPFSTIGNSEKPDKVAAKLLEGRVAILCNGTPFVLTVPYLFVETLQYTDDYYSKSFFASSLRLLRFFAFLISLTLPAMYVAIGAFHQEMLANVLLITVSASREGIPFPLFIEVLFTEIIFQLVRESGIRMPKAIGSAISIVGTLVIGEAAVNAGIIGAPMVIIVGLSAITSFIISALFDSVILFRFLLILLGGLFGLFGIAVGLICILAHMCSLESFGTPFMMPLGPRRWYALKDSIIRVPLKFMRKKPYL